MNDCLVLCRRVHSLLLLGLLPVVGYFYASLRRFLLLLLLFLFFFFVISSSFVVTNRVFVARRPTCSVHPDAFLFWRRFDLPSPPPPPRMSKVSGFEIKKAHPLGGGGRRRGEPTTGGAKLSSPTPRVFERRAQGKRGVSAVGWKNTTLLSPSSLRLNFSLAAHFSLRFIAFSLPRNILCTVLNISSVPFSR